MTSVRNSVKLIFGGAKSKQIVCLNLQPTVTFKMDFKDIKYAAISQSFAPSRVKKKTL